MSENIPLGDALNNEYKDSSVAKFMDYINEINILMNDMQTNVMLSQHVSPGDRVIPVMAAAAIIGYTYNKVFCASAANDDYPFKHITSNQADYIKRYSEELIHRIASCSTDLTPERIKELLEEV